MIARKNYIPFRLAHSSRTSLTRVCQPLPVERRKSTRFLSSRIATCSLFEPAGRPRDRLYCAIPARILFREGVSRGRWMSLKQRLTKNTARTNTAGTIRRLLTQSKYGSLTGKTDFAGFPVSPSLKKKQGHDASRLTSRFTSWRNGHDACFCG